MEGLSNHQRHWAIQLAARISAVILLVLTLIVFLVEISDRSVPVLGGVGIFWYGLNFGGLLSRQRWLNLIALLGSGLSIIFAFLLLGAYVRQSSLVGVGALWLILFTILLHVFCFYELIHRYRQIRSAGAQV